MRLIQRFASFLTFLGAISYGIQAVFNFNLFSHLFYNLPSLLKLIYFLIGISAFINLSCSAENKKK